MKTKRTWAWWAPLLILAAVVAACQPPSVTPTAVKPTPDTPAPTPTSPTTRPQASCDNSAIRLLDRGQGIHGAIVADVLHMGGAKAPVTCADPVNESLAAVPGGPAAQQVQQPQYFLIVIRYPESTRLYILRRGGGKTCVVDTNNECVAEVSDLPDDFEIGDLPDDVEPVIPAGRDAPAPPVSVETEPDAVENPHPSDGATGVTVDAPLLSWSASPRAASYDLYWGTTQDLAADPDLNTPIDTSNTAVTIRARGETAAEQRLTAETTYYWRVDAKNDAGATRGNVWSFTTGAAPPPGGGYTPPVVGPPPVSPSVSIADAKFPEGSGRLVTQQGYTTPIWESTTNRYPVAVELSGPAAETVRVQYWVTDGTATKSVDYLGYEAVTHYLWFRDGDTSETLYMYIVGDLEEEGDETFNVNLQPLDGVTCGRCQATMTITDDD